MPVSSVANRPPCAHDAAEARFAPGTARHRAINREKHRSADAYDARGVRGNVPDRAQREARLLALREACVHAPQAPERVSFAHDQPPVPVHVSKVSRPSYPKHHQLTRWYVERPQDARERASRLAPRPPVQSDTGVPSIVKNARLKAPLFSIKPQNAKLTAEALMMLGGNPLRSEAKQLAFERDVARYVRACQTQPFDYWLLELGEIVIRHNIPTPEVFTLICRFGILGNAITQMFFPGWSTIDLVGREIEMGMLYQLFDRIRHLEPSALLPVAYSAVMRIERAPLDAAKFIEHPVATIAEILETLFGPIRKTA